MLKICYINNKECVCVLRPYSGSVLSWSSVFYSIRGNTLLEDAYEQQAKESISGSQVEGEKKSRLFLIKDGESVKTEKEQLKWNVCFLCSSTEMNSSLKIKTNNYCIYKVYSSYCICLIFIFYISFICFFQVLFSLMCGKNINKELAARISGLRGLIQSFL